MQAQRLLDNLQAQHDKSLDDFFGNPSLIDESYTVTPFESVKKVAVLTESFLPKVDGVVKTTYLTVRYLQETGREVLVFAPDIAVDHVGDSKVIPLPSISLPQAPRDANGVAEPGRRPSYRGLQSGSHTSVQSGGDGGKRHGGWASPEFARHRQLPDRLARIYRALRLPPVVGARSIAGCVTFTTAAT